MRRKPLSDRYSVPSKREQGSTLFWTVYCNFWDLFSVGDGYFLTLQIHEVVEIRFVFLTWVDTVEVHPNNSIENGSIISQELKALAESESSNSVRAYIHFTVTALWLKSPSSDAGSAFSHENWIYYWGTQFFIFFQAIYTLDTELQSQEQDMVCPSSN